MLCMYIQTDRATEMSYIYPFHTGDFPRGVGHRVENGRGLTKVAVVLLNGLIW